MQLHGFEVLSSTNTVERDPGRDGAGGEGRIGSLMIGHRQWPNPCASAACTSRELSPTGRSAPSTSHGNAPCLHDIRRCAVVSEVNPLPSERDSSGRGPPSRVSPRGLITVVTAGIASPAALLDRYEDLPRIHVGRNQVESTEIHRTSGE